MTITEVAIELRSYAKRRNAPLSVLEVWADAWPAAAREHAEEVERLSDRLEKIRLLSAEPLLPANRCEAETRGLAQDILEACGPCLT